MANKRITQLPTAPQVEDNDYLAIDNTSTPTAENEGGTRKIKASEVGDKVATENPSPTDYGEYAILATYSDVSEEKTKDKTRKTDFLYNATNQKIVARGAYDTTTYCDNEIGLSHSRANEDDKFQILPSGIWASASDSDVVAGLTVDDTTHEGYGVVSKYEEDESSSTTTKSTQKYNKFTLEKTYEDWDAEEVTVLESLEMSTDDIETSKTWDGTNTSLKDALRVNDVKGTVENAQIATFSDGAPLPMPKLEIAVEPQQDLHGYDAPWVGGSGKNKFPIATATSSGTQNIFSAQTVPLKANTNYVLSFDSATPTTKDMSLSFNNGNTQVRGITISAGVTSVNLTFNQNIDNIDWYVREAVNLSNIMIEEGSTKTTFAPYSNECPISGWSAVDVSVVGKNLFKLNSSFTSSDVISSIDTSTGKVGIADTSSIKWVAPYFAYSDVMEGQTYTLSVDSLLKYGRVGGSLSYTTPPQPSNIPDTDIGTNIQGAVNNAFSSRTFTANKTQRIYWYYCTDANNSNHQAFDFYPQLELGTESSTMTPYNGQTYKVEFKDGDNPLTVYGGSLDVVSGVLTVERAYVDLGTLDWSMSSSTAHGFYARPSLNYALGEDVVILCSNYPFAGTRTIGYYVENKLTCYRRLEEPAPSEFYIQDNAYSDATTFKTAMNGVQLVYELDTPQTYQLTPTQVSSLLGSNNVWANTGNIIKLEYIRDLNITINELIQRIENLEG